MEKQVLYTIWFATGGKEEAAIRLLADIYLNGYTLYSTIGAWAGEVEPAWKLEILTENQGEYLVWFEGEVRALAEQIKVAFGQQAVLVTKQEITMETI